MIKDVVMKKIIALVLGILCLTACGKRGRLDFPPNSSYPRQYPAARQPKQKNVSLLPVSKDIKQKNEEILIETEEK